MAFPDRLRLPLSFDPALLARDLRAASGAGWTKHVVRQNYDGDWSVIALRAPAGETHPLRMIYPDPKATSFVDTSLLERCAHFREVLAAFKCPLRTVRLMRLTPGSVIKEHVDVALGFEDGMVRVHIPIETNADVDFRLNGTRIVMEAGSAWYVRLSDPHSVINGGATDRVHLVIDAFVNDWLAGVLQQAVQLHPVLDNAV